MVDEVVEFLRLVPNGVAVDATVGGGGHARALLEAHPGLTLLGLDRDHSALEAAARVLAPFGTRVVLRHARFDTMAAVLDELGTGPITACLFDLGVSSPQFDRPDRGFSYRTDAGLDMRMDTGDERTAAHVVNTYDQRTLAALFAANGEGRFAGRIARAIIAARPVTRTGQLAEIVRDAIPAPARRTGGHPAKRVFQALRIEVNSELEVLPVALDTAIDRLTAGGRLVVLSYHSGEDRIAKERMMAAESGGCHCPPGLPCQCGATPTGRRVRRGSLKANAAEVGTNPRAGSARLRVLEKLDIPAGRHPSGDPT